MLQLTDLGQSSSMAGLSAQQANYYYNFLLRRIKQTGFDILTDDQIIFLIAPQDFTVIQQFEGKTNIEEVFNSELEYQRINYEQIAQNMNEFTQQFAYITAEDLADKLVSNSERN